MTAVSRTVFNQDCELDVSYYCNREGYVTIAVVSPSYSNYTGYCHQGVFLSILFILLVIYYCRKELEVNSFQQIFSVHLYL